MDTTIQDFSLDIPEPDMTFEEAVEAIVAGIRSHAVVAQEVYVMYMTPEDFQWCVENLACFQVAQ